MKLPAWQIQTLDARLAELESKPEKGSCWKDCVLPDPFGMGHVDHVVVPAGTTVKLPLGGRGQSRAMRSLTPRDADWRI